MGLFVNLSFYHNVCFSFIHICTAPLSSCLLSAQHDKFNNDDDDDEFSGGRIKVRLNVTGWLEHRNRDHRVPRSTLTKCGVKYSHGQAAHANASVNKLHKLVPA